jgi:hypothetical protein
MVVRERMLYYDDKDKYKAVYVNESPTGNCQLFSIGGFA